MSFVQPSIGKLGAIDHTLIITKYIAIVVYGNTQVSEGISQINKLLNTSPPGTKLSSISCCLSS